MKTQIQPFLYLSSIGGLVVVRMDFNVREQTPILIEDEALCLILNHVEEY